MGEDKLKRIEDVWRRWDVGCNIPIWDAMEEIGEILRED